MVIPRPFVCYIFIMNSHTTLHDRPDEPDYLREARRILDGLLGSSTPPDRRDILSLINAKHAAHREGGIGFEEVLLDMARALGEIMRHSGDGGLSEGFDSITGYFERYDRMLDLTGRAVISDRELSEEWFNDFLDGKRKFDELQEGLFHKLFLKDLLTNRYISGHGRRKIRIIAEGLEEVASGRASMKDVLYLLRKTASGKFPFKDSFA